MMKLHWTPEAIQDRETIYDVTGDLVRMLRVLHAAKQWRRG